MSMSEPQLWSVKLASRLQGADTSPDIAPWIQQADGWASAADRPCWPAQEALGAPVLIHPLTGGQVQLGAQPAQGQAVTDRCLDRQRDLLRELGDADTLGPGADRRKFLTLWRFAPEPVGGQAGSCFWHLLPADARVPDHSVWDHLDLTSAFAGAFAADADGQAALLTLSIGPVQSFIAAAKTSTDLWAGSHLLARLAWEAMKPLCAQFGPDAVLFPRLRGIAQVDLWLRDEMQLPSGLFKDAEWMREGSDDASPLFSAALPNRFVAVVPASQAAEMARQCTDAVRAWLQDQGQEVVRRLLEVVGESGRSDAYCFQQMKEQLAEFPEVHWAAVPFSIVRAPPGDGHRRIDTSTLNQAMKPFFGASASGECGFLDSPVWKILREELPWDAQSKFWIPHPGALYPAVFDLAERALAAAKATRSFQQLPQQGWRCSLTGESEWLSLDKAQLLLPPGQRKQAQTLWTRVSQARRSWALPGEHLGALAALKRVWPSLYTQEVATATGGAVNRGVVSTHTMALTHALDQWLQRGGITTAGLSRALDRQGKDPQVALPRRLIHRFKDMPQALQDARRILSLLEDAAPEENSEGNASVRGLVREALNPRTEGGQFSAPLETYYGLLMMDGDRMGAILSGDEATGTAIPYRDSFHPGVRSAFDRRASKQSKLHAYGQQARAISPHRHLAISGALNDFSQTVVRHVIEKEHFGRVIYSGGDDVLAMLPTVDLLAAMQRLRQAYSGTADPAVAWDPSQAAASTDAERQDLRVGAGYAALGGRWMRMMGERATASCGAIIAHHQTPLNTVMTELRLAEQRAKGEGGRDAFSITVLKRSGGALFVTSKWTSQDGSDPMRLLMNTIEFLKDEGTSRKAVYDCLAWVKDLPHPQRQGQDMLASLLAYQMDRKSSGMARRNAPILAEQLARSAALQGRDALKWLENFMSIAEFLARETRSGDRS